MIKNQLGRQRDKTAREFLCVLPFFFYKNHAYKNVDAQITQKIKNIVVVLLVAISISYDLVLTKTKKIRSRDRNCMTF